MKQFQLKERIDVLLAILGAKDDPFYNEFAKLLREVQKLAVERNLIAHNGLGIDVYVNAATGGILAKESIRSARNEDKHLEFAELVKHREQAEHLEFELYELWMFVSGVREQEDE